MALKMYYASGRRLDGMQVDGGPFFSEADARQWTREQRLTAVVVDEVTRKEGIGR